MSYRLANGDTSDSSRYITSSGSQVYDYYTDAYIDIAEEEPSGRSRGGGGFVGYYKKETEVDQTAKKEWDFYYYAYSVREDEERPSYRYVLYVGTIFICAAIFWLNYVGLHGSLAAKIIELVIIAASIPFFVGVGSKAASILTLACIFNYFFFWRTFSLVYFGTWTEVLW